MSLRICTILIVFCYTTLCQLPFQQEGRDTKWWYWEDDSSHYHFTSDWGQLPASQKEYFQNFWGTIETRLAKMDQDTAVEFVVLATILRRSDVDYSVDIFKAQHGYYVHSDGLYFTHMELALIDIDNDGIQEVVGTNEQENIYWMFESGKLWHIDSLVIRKLGHQSLTEFQKASGICPTGGVNPETVQAIRRQLMK